MASLKDTKNRINSVNSTLKITSAMKMVASAKLRHAQNAIESMNPYESKLREMLELLLATVPADKLHEIIHDGPASSEGTVALVAFASNSSLCGGFNVNALHAVKARISELEAQGFKVEVISVGRKMADAMKKAGYPSARDWSALVNEASYAAVEELADLLNDSFMEGKYSRVELIYNHFISTSSQKVLQETYLPMDIPVQDATSIIENPEDIIIEPTPEQMLADLLPCVRSLRLYTVVLDTLAAEHAARTVAMQTATDNGEELLHDLTIEYNKARQQKITNEILDLVSGSMH